MAEKLKPKDIVPMSAFECVALKSSAIYAIPNHPNNHFGELYGPGADIWLHKDLAVVTVLAAEILNRQFGWVMCVLDGLRSIEAQEKMASKGFNPELVSVPGTGAHPRAMAVDVEVCDAKGELVDMGTPFDHFALDMSNNSAGRGYIDFGNGARVMEVCQNRNRLETAFLLAAHSCGRFVLPLPQEWWDFREPEVRWSRFEAWSEKEMPNYMRQVEPMGEICQIRHKEAVVFVKEVVKTKLESLGFDRL